MLTASTCLLGDFKRMWFVENRQDDEFNAIHLEYVDLSGLTKTRELELNSQLYSLQNRCERVKWLLYGLRVSVAELGKPFDAGIDDLRSLGHKLYWDGDAALFFSLLNKIEGKESKYKMQLEEKEREVIEFHKAQSTGKTTVTQTRQAFIKNEIELRKRGHYITDQITVETFALIIKSENEEAEKLNKKK